MPTPQRLGMPQLDDVAAQYRLHADQIANGEVQRPRYAVVIEFYEGEPPCAHCFGTAPESRTESMHAMTEGVIALAETIQDLNAGGSH